MGKNVLLEVKDLSLNYVTDDGTIYAVNNLSFQLHKGSTLCLVGETGAGKTSTAKAIMGILPRLQSRIVSGEILMEGTNLLELNNKRMQKIRGSRLSMISQDPMTSLNPVMRVVEQVSEVLLLHKTKSRVEAVKMAKEVLLQVGIKEDRVMEYPHQFSGGMRQRVGIAMALACSPEVLIADEPTTALDVTIQAQVLELMKNLKKQYEMSMIMITHDLGIVAEICDYVAVMYAGSIVEYGDKRQIFTNASHPYTIGLFGCIPDLSIAQEELIPIKGMTPDPSAPRGAHLRPGAAGPPSAASPAVWTPMRSSLDTGCGACNTRRRTPDMPEKLVDIHGLKKYFSTSKGVLHAVDDVDFFINRGETLGLVGESGCGKSTTGRLLLRLIEPTAGEILVDGENIAAFSNKRMREFRKRMQIVFQDPYASLDSRFSVYESIEEPLRIHKIYHDPKEMERRVFELMETVGLAPRVINSFPHELDGGRRQRVGIARALALNPELIVLDEPVSALDVSIQAQILNLLQNLQRQMGLTYLFISHNLSVVKHISDRVAVMYLGKIVELADTEDLFSNPLHPYTKALLSAVPTPHIDTERSRIVLEGDVPSPINPPARCRFYNRCYCRCEGCENTETALREVRPNHFVSCLRV